MDNEKASAEGKKENTKLFKTWSETIKAYEKRFDPWMTQAEKIEERYRDDKSLAAADKFNIFYSDIQTLCPAVYNRPPVPVVERRNRSKDDIGRVSSTLLENATSHCVDGYDFDYVMQLTVLDWALTGRGVAWERYEAETTEEPQENADGTPTLDDKGNAVTMPRISYQSVITDFIPYKDFGHTPARNWTEVKGVWKRTLMDRDELVARFKDKGKDIPLTHTGEGIKANNGKEGGQEATHALIYEIWDKPNMQVIWLSLEQDEELEVKPDIYKLKDFFPCPRPIMGKVPGSSLIPMPIYNQVRHQLAEADMLTQQISNLSEQLRVAGVYDQTETALANLLKSKGNKLIPVKGFSGFKNKGGIKGSVDFLPLADVVAALQAATTARAQVKADIDEVLGIGDIIRGQSSGPRATATEQRIKGNFATLRLDDIKGEVARFARDLIRIKAELIAEHFEDAEIVAASDLTTFTPEEQAIIPQALQMLRDEKQRGFHIDIETDSTVAIDENEEQQSRMAFVTTVGDLMQKALPVIQAAPEIAPLIGEMVLFTVRTFNKGRQLESSFESFVDQLNKSAKQAQMNKGQPTPEQKNAEAELAIKKQDADTNRIEAGTKQFQATTDRIEAMKPEPAPQPPLQQRVIH